MGLFQGAFEMEKELVSKAENASLQTKEEDHPVPPPRNPHVSLFRYKMFLNFLLETIQLFIQKKNNKFKFYQS